MPDSKLDAAPRPAVMFASMEFQLAVAECGTRLCDVPDGPDFVDSPELMTDADGLLLDDDVLEKLRPRVESLLQPYFDHFESRGWFRADPLSKPIIRQIGNEERGSRILFMAVIKDPRERTPGDTYAGDWASWFEKSDPEGFCASSSVAVCTLYPDVTAETEIGRMQLEDYHRVLASRRHAEFNVWGPRINAHKLPKPGEDFQTWVDRVAITLAEHESHLKRLEIAGDDFDLFAASARVGKLGAKSIEFVVPGLIPRAMVTVLVGSKETGKSTLMDDLCARLERSSGQPLDFLGAPIDGGMVTALFSGEDPEQTLYDRRQYFEREWGCGAGFVIDATRRTFEESITLVRSAPRIDLIVFDPARRFIDGDEDNSANVSAFFDKLVALAQDKNCGIVVIQHVKKEQRSRSIADIVPRGSGVFMDRPRVVLAMYEAAGGLIGFGVKKHNMPPSAGMWPRGEARLFRRDPERLTLVPVSSPNRASESAMSVDVAQLVTVAVRKLVSEGEQVFQTGKTELYERRLPEIAGISRGKIRQTVAELIAAGRLAESAEGLVVIDT